MSVELRRFYDSITDVAGLGARQVVAVFVYFLTVEQSADFATAKMVEDCFRGCSLTPPTRIAQYLSEGIGRNEYVKHSTGYRLQRHYYDELKELLGASTSTMQSHPELRRLEGRVIGTKKEFLRETIDCFEAGANRATIVMCWILTIDHLYDYILAKHLPAFNAALAKLTDKRIRVSVVCSKDDFTDIPENKLIELMRGAGIISNDVRKILEEKLGIRNTCAHPSGVAIKPTKVVEFVDDLIENVVLKYN
jgi:hypothetical protein